MFLVQNWLSRRNVILSPDADHVIHEQHNVFLSFYFLPENNTWLFSCKKTCTFPFAFVTCRQANGPLGRVGWWDLRGRRYLPVALDISQHSVINLDREEGDIWAWRKSRILNPVYHKPVAHIITLLNIIFFYPKCYVLFQHFRAGTSFLLKENTLHGNKWLLAFIKPFQKIDLIFLWDILMQGEARAGESQHTNGDNNI